MVVTVTENILFNFGESNLSLRVGEPLPTTINIRERLETKSDFRRAKELQFISPSLKYIRAVCGNRRNDGDDEEERRKQV